MVDYEANKALFSNFGLLNEFQDLVGSTKNICNQTFFLNLKRVGSKVHANMSNLILLKNAYTNATSNAKMSMGTAGVREYTDMLKSDASYVSELRQACLSDCRMISAYLNQMKIPNNIMNFERTKEQMEHSSDVKVLLCCANFKVIRQMQIALDAVLEKFKYVPRPTTPYSESQPRETIPKVPTSPTPKPPASSSWFSGRGNARAKRSKDMVGKIGNSGSLAESPEILSEMRRLLLV